jgi:hypothetical protein
MLQSYATNTGGNAQIWMLDLSAGPQQRLLMDYAYGAEAFERDPRRWKPEMMPDAEHAAAVKSFKGAQS